MSELTGDGAGSFVDELSEVAWRAGQFGSRDAASFWAHDFVMRLADQAYVDTSPDAPEDCGVYDAYDTGVERMYESIKRLGE